MAEAAASVLALATVAVKLSRTLYHVGHNTVSAGHNINRIATNVTLFASILKHVGATFQDSRSLHSAEAVETVEQIVEESNILFKEITSTVISATNKTKEEPVGANGRRSRRISVLQRAKWHFEQPIVEYFLAQLEYLKTTLSVLVQTLSLAALLANLRYNEGRDGRDKTTGSSKVDEERMHIETLVVAQHLSVVMLDRIQDREGNEQDQRVSSSDESEITGDSRQPKLATQGHSPFTSMVRLGDGNLGFLERKGSVDGEETLPNISRSQLFIDELIRRWTRPPEQLFTLVSQDACRQLDPEGQQFPFEKAASLTPSEESSEDEDDTGESVPNLRLHPVESPDTIIPEASENASSEWLLDPNATPRPKDSNRSTPSPTPKAPSAFSSASHQTNPQANSKAVLARSTSNPEGDGAQLQLDTFHDHHGLERQERPPSTVPSLASGVTRSAASPAPLEMPMPNNLSSLAYYTRSPVPSSTGSLIASPPSSYPRTNYPPSYPKNYRPPYVSSHCSSSSDDSDSGTHSSPSTPRERRRRFSPERRASNMSKPSDRDSGIGSGLGIPWRIRISGTKYFDFRDGKLVGPRQPYTPTEPLSWVYSHDNACTEVSKRWVCEEALHEKRLRFVETHEEPDFAMGMGLEEDDGSWRILQPLKFDEVNTLVERTIDIYRAKTMAPVPFRPAGSGSPRHHPPPKPSRLNVPQHSPSLPHPPQFASPHQYTNPYNRFSGQQRSVSFNGTSPHQQQFHPTPNRAGTGATSDRSPRDSAEYPHYIAQPPLPSPQAYGPPQGPPFPPNPRFHSAPPEWWREPHHRPHREHRHARKEYDRSRDPDHRDRSSRPSSRGGPSGKYKEKEKKKSGSSVASTLAKIGGLAAMLEGLDMVV